MNQDQRVYLSALESSRVHLQFHSRLPGVIEEIVLKPDGISKVEIALGDVRLLVKLPEELTISDGLTMAVDFEILDVLTPEPARKAFQALLERRYQGSTPDDRPRHTCLACGALEGLVERNVREFLCEFCHEVAIQVNTKEPPDFEATGQKGCHCCKPGEPDSEADMIEEHEAVNEAVGSCS